MPYSKISKIYIVHNRTVLALIEDGSNVLICHFGQDGVLLGKILLEQCEVGKENFQVINSVTVVALL